MAGRRRRLPAATLMFLFALFVVCSVSVLYLGMQQEEHAMVRKSNLQNPKLYRLPAHRRQARNGRPVQRKKLQEKESVPLTDSATRTTRNMTVGILVARRDRPTIYYLLEHLLSEPRAAEDFVIIVHVAYSASQDEELLEYLRRLKDVVITVVEEKPYPEAMEENITDTHGDSMERTVWRTTHALDYRNLLTKVLAFGATYNLILEDDVKPAKYALHKAHEFAIMLENRTDWGFLTFYSGVRRDEFVTDLRGKQYSGACSWLFRHRIARKLLRVLSVEAQNSPVDMIIPRHVHDVLGLTVYERTPNLFQHASLKSTYTGHDAKKRKAETWRSRSFEYDEDNSTLALTAALNADGYMGCFKDTPLLLNSDLSGIFDGTMKHSSIYQCRLFCKEYFYFGLQSGFRCSCGNEFASHHRVDDSECNRPCGKKNKDICGGNWTSSVYRVVPYHAAYVGCYNSPPFMKRSKTTVSSIDSCVEACGSALYIGLVGGDQCYCWNQLELNSKLDDERCNLRCHGEPSQICGGKASVVVYMQID